jgi:hypothetical protein
MKKYKNTKIDYNAVNLKNGYPPLEIRNPKELIDYGKRF